MQEMKDVTLAEIAKAFEGRVIYAPGGTVNIGCVVNNFDGPPPSKKTQAAPGRIARPAEQNAAAVPPVGQTTPPPPPAADPTDDDEGDESNGPTPGPEAAAEPAQDGSSWGRGTWGEPEPNSSPPWVHPSSEAEVPPSGAATTPNPRRPRSRRGSTSADRGG
jgi:hypothetical protein